MRAVKGETAEAPLEVIAALSNRAVVRPSRALINICKIVSGSNQSYSIYKQYILVLFNEIKPWKIEGFSYLKLPCDID